MCIQNLKRRKSRTLLTLLGVIIGCCSIVIMVSIGLGSAESQNQMLQQMGDLTIITVTPKESGSNKQKLNSNAISKMKSLSNVISVTPKISLEDYDCTVKVYAGENDRYVSTSSTIVGIDTSELEQMGYKLTSGSNVSQSNEVLAGQYLAYNFADSLRPEGSNMIDRWGDESEDSEESSNIPDPYFDTTKTTMTIEVEVNGKKSRFPVKTTGVLKEDDVKGSETSEGIVMSLNDIQQLLSTSLGTNQNGIEYKTALVKVNDLTKVAEVEKTIQKLGFSTSSMESIREPMEKEARQKQLMLGGLGAISLFVAALGITNTMIMSISERTREIGIMKSLGCYIKDIRVMFLMEAGIIGLLGGIIGAIISSIIGFLINLFSIEGTFSLEKIGMAIVGGESVTRVCVTPIWLLFVAIIFSILIGLGSGYYPANKAVQISALEAIKSN